MGLSKYEAIHNDHAFNWCDSTSEYADGFGTPGQANDQCPNAETTKCTLQESVKVVVDGALAEGTALAQVGQSFEFALSKTNPCDETIVFNTSNGCLYGAGFGVNEQGTMASFYNMCTMMPTQWSLAPGETAEEWFHVSDELPEGNWWLSPSPAGEPDGEPALTVVDDSGNSPD